MNARRGRRLDLGPLSVGRYVATDRTLLDRRARGVIPDTLTFLHFDRPGALLGFHQSPAQELHLERAHARKLPLQRRLTGGGALYVDDGVFGWELYLHKSSLKSAHLAEVADALCTLAARGLSSLGVDAEFRPRNDIEVGGRKICGTGGVQEGDALLYQGSLLLDFDVEHMVDVLRIPAEKLRDKAVEDARLRVTCLRALLGVRPAEAIVADALAQAFSDGLGISFESESLSSDECAEIARVEQELSDPEWLGQNDRPAQETPVWEGVRRTRGGLLRTALLVDTRRERIKQAWFTGDFFVHPRRLIPDLEATLRDTPMERTEALIGSFFERYGADLLLLTAADFADAVRGVLSAGQRAHQEACA